MIFKTEGFAELNDQLIQLAQGFRTDLVMRNTAVKAAKRAMVPVENDVKINAPYDEDNTGPIHLRNTVRLDSRIPNARDRNSIMVSQSDVVIGVVSVKKSAVSLSQEFGNATTAAQPYLRVSLERNRDEVVRILGEELGTLIPAYAKKLAKRKV
jgi:hypothetical protein